MRDAMIANASPRLTRNPTLKSVDDMPAATPRRTTGTELMNDATFGAMNKPLPVPATIRRAPRGGERGVSEQCEVHHRRRHHPLNRHEGDEARDAREQHDEVDRRPTGNRAERDAEEREGQAAREEKISRRIEFLAARMGPELL